MAYTKIKNIKSTVSKAIDYITNISKTNRGSLVYGYNVTPKTASIEFSFTEKMAENIVGNFKRENGNLAYHIIQSFDYKDIITPEEALEIGRKTVEQLTNEKFEYVIATHVDRTCIHNHIIFNSVSFVDFKRFNCKPYKTVATLRSISDKLCIEKGLNVIKEQKNDSKSYYEWTMQKAGLSWKATLRNIIDKNIIKSKDFDEFLSLMRKNDYEIKQGKYIAFKHIGQERFIRSYKLGFDYSEERIKERISSESKIIKYKNKIISKRELPINIILMLRNRKEVIKNIKSIAQNLYVLEKEFNVKTMKDLKVKIGEISVHSNETRKEIIETEKKIKQKQEEQRNILIYEKYKTVNDKYIKALNKNSFKQKHESELILFESAKNYIEENKLENINILKEMNETKIKELQNTYIQNKEDLLKYKNSYDFISKVEKQINDINIKSNKKAKTKKRDITI